MIVKNNFGGVDLLQTVIELDKRIAALEDKQPKPAPSPTVSERVDKMLADAAKSLPKETEHGDQGSEPGAQGVV